MINSQKFEDPAFHQSNSPPLQESLSSSSQGFIQTPKKTSNQLFTSSSFPSLEHATEKSTKENNDDIVSQFSSASSTVPASSGHATFGAAFIQIGNTILGAGIISLPVVMRYLGIVLGSIFLLIISLCTIYSVYVLLVAHHITKRNKYSTITRATLGDFGYFMTIIMIVINNFGLCCAYFRIFGETMVNTIQGYVSKESYWVRHNYMYVLFLLLIMAFIIYTDNFESFEKTSSLGVIGIIIYCIGLFVIFFYKLFSGLLLNSNIPFFPDSFSLDLVASLPSVFLSFSFQFNVFPIYFTLMHRTRHNMMQATSSSISFCLILYILSALCCVLMYGTDMTDTTLNMLLVDMQKYKDDMFMKVTLIITNISFLICSTSGIPLMFYSLKQSIFDGIIYFGDKKKEEKEIEMITKNKENQKENVHHEKEIVIEGKENEIADKVDEESNHQVQEAGETPKGIITSGNIGNKNQVQNRGTEEINNPEVSRMTKIITSCVLYALIGIITLVVPQLKMLFNIVGSTASNSIAFIIPNLIAIYLPDQSREYISSLAPKIILFFGVVILFVCFSAEIINAL